MVLVRLSIVILVAVHVSQCSSICQANLQGQQRPRNRGHFGCSECLRWFSRCRIDARGQLVTWGNLQSQGFFPIIANRTGVSLVISTRPVAAMPSDFPVRVAIVRSSSLYLTMSGCLTSWPRGKLQRRIYPVGSCSLELRVLQRILIFAG